MPYEWEDWALAALAGIEAYEVRQTLEARRRWPRRAMSATGIAVLTVWGRTSTGRPLVVAVYQATDFTWKIIGARDMNDDELIEFSRWEETR
ncbi:hypothetical protein [Actinoplanes regularis]|uniref:hypothetical protein n=1 Tax=Actinoplanes regularis TaxID=52697 RepID=UPI000B78DCCC|nr:hypothetical protein [Actinoplanes regularis]